ncbi:MAG TPA: hypothetical protein VJH34_03995 [archaeon]|nr:hypothetical protein [archaeon]
MNISTMVIGSAMNGKLNAVIVPISCVNSFVPAGLFTITFARV